MTLQRAAVMSLIGGALGVLAGVLGSFLLQNTLHWEMQLSTQTMAIAGLFSAGLRNQEEPSLPFDSNTGVLARPSTGAHCQIKLVAERCVHKLLDGGNDRYFVQRVPAAGKG